MNRIFTLAFVSVFVTVAFMIAFFFLPVNSFSIVTLVALFAISTVLWFIAAVRPIHA